MVGPESVIRSSAVTSGWRACWSGSWVRPRWPGVWFGPGGGPRRGVIAEPGTVFSFVKLFEELLSHPLSSVAVMESRIESAEAIDAAGAGCVCRVLAVWRSRRSAMASWWSG